MTTNEKELQKILHDLDHQKLEAIGVEILAAQSAMFILTLMATVTVSDKGLDRTQVIASLSTLAKWARDGMCPACVELSERIEHEMERSFQEFMREKKYEKK